MWVLLWFILVFVIVSLWAAPEYWGRKVYPFIVVEAEAVDVFADIGDPVIFRCRITNPTRLPCPRVRLFWKLPEQLNNGSDNEKDLVEADFYLMARQLAEVTFTVYAARRGVAQWNEAYLEFTDALGLHKEYRTVYVQARAVVRPKRRSPVPMTNPLTELIGEIRTRRFYNEDPSLFTGVRAYQPGDSLRAISWFATASKGELMVKQFGYTTASKVLVLFNGQMFESHWKTAYKNRIDAMCGRLLQMSEKLLQNGTAVGLLTNLNDNVTMNFYEPPATGEYQLARLANKMGCVSPYPMCSLADLIRSGTKHAAQGDTVVLFSSYWDQEGIRALLDLNGKTKNVVVYCMDWDGTAFHLHGIPTIIEHLDEEADIVAGGEMEEDAS